MQQPDKGDQEQLDLGDADLYGKARRVERAVRQSVDAAQLDKLDAGAAALAVELARAVDVASGRKDPYGVEAAGRGLREQLVRLRLDPEARHQESGNDGISSWLDQLGPDAPGGVDGPATVPDTPHA